MSICKPVSLGTVSVIVMIGCMGAAYAQNSSSSETDAVQDVLSCRNLADPMERLVCLDTALPALASVFPESAMSNEERAALQARQAEQNKAAAEAAFGQSIEVQSAKVAQKQVLADADDGTAKTSELTELGSTVKDMKFTSLGRAIVYFDNGQVWQQLASDTRKLRASSSIGETVTVKKKLMGSHMMKIGNGRLVRVERLQ